jgi:glycerol-3-phosphate dehydrogenase (NAD(P)+)
MTQYHETITIFGAGQFGTALAMLASINCKKVFLYDRDENRAQKIQETRINDKYLPQFKLPDSIFITSNMNQCIESSTLLMPILPSKSMREFSKKISTLIDPNHHIIIHGTKGFEPITFKRMSDVIKEETKIKKIGVLSGPNLAIEIAQGQPAATVVASEDKEVIEFAQKIFASPRFRVYGNTDMIGVEWAGTLKNILAIASGICNGLGFGNNVMAMLITRGFAEMSRLITAMGAHTYTLVGLAGIGDIITTCTSPLSRNFTAGKLLAQGYKIDELEKKLGMTIEGINTVKAAYNLAKEKKIELPITEALYHVIFNSQPIKQSITELMSRPTTYEFQFQ